MLIVGPINTRTPFKQIDNIMRGESIKIEQKESEFDISLKLLIMVHCECSIYIYWGRRVIGISESLIWSKTLMELIFNPCGEYR